MDSQVDQQKQQASLSTLDPSDLGGETPLNYDRLKTVLYEVALKAIKETGDAYKNLSWLARNKPKNPTMLIEEECPCQACSPK